MVPIYALPDHEVVGRLLPGCFDALMVDAQAVDLIRSKPGLIPAAIEHQHDGQRSARVYWVDIGAHPYKDWQHLFTIERLAQAGLIETAFATSLKVLDADDLIPGALIPSGFIFHTSRCGSTLLGKALARVPEHSVVNQGGPLQRGFWAAHTDDWRKAMPDDARMLKRFRNLVFALTRPRRGGEKFSFVKFISWNTLYLDFIAKAFPEVRSLFLFRDPVEVIASVIKETTAVLIAKDWRQAAFLTGENQKNIKKMSDAVYLAHCYNNYFKKILNSSMANVAALDYRNLKAGRLKEILHLGFAFDPGDEVIVEMCTQFRFHSKDDSDRSTFQSDDVVKQALVADKDKMQIGRITMAQLQDLRAAPHTLFRVNVHKAEGVAN